jgi:hypothetical protein
MIANMKGARSISESEMFRLELRRLSDVDERAEMTAKMNNVVN